MEKDLDDEVKAIEEIYNIRIGKRLANSTIALAVKRDAICKSLKMMIEALGSYDKYLNPPS